MTSYQSPVACVSIPLGGKESVEVRAAGLALRVLHGVDVGQDVVALAAGFVLTDQLSLEKGRPPLLQSLHPSDIRLSGREDKDEPSGNSVEPNE